MKLAKLNTTKGLLVAELLDEDAPMTVANFIKLAALGFYNGLSFFKYIPEVLVQTGCPLNNGLGFPGYHIKCELDGKRQWHQKGVFSMVHNTRDTNGSQFIICLGDRYTQHLNGNHTCFAILTDKRMEVLLKLRQGDRIESIEIEEVERFPLGENVKLFR